MFSWTTASDTYHFRTNIDYLSFFLCRLDKYDSLGFHDIYLYFFQGMPCNIHSLQLSYTCREHTSYCTSEGPGHDSHRHASTVGISRKISLKCSCFENVKNVVLSSNNRRFVRVYLAYSAISAISNEVSRPLVTFAM